MVRGVLFSTPSCSSTASRRRSMKWSTPSPGEIRPAWPAVPSSLSQAIPVQYSSGVMSRSSIALNRSDISRWTICLVRGSPPWPSRLATARRNCCTSGVSIIFTLIGSFSLAVSAVVVADGRRVAAQRRHRDAHVGEQRQAGQEPVQLLVAVHVENAVVGVLAGHAPDVAPLAAALQLLRVRLLARLDVGGDVFGQVGRDLDVHPDLEKHGSGLLVGNADGAGGAVAAEELHAVLVQVDAQSGAVR